MNFTEIKVADLPGFIESEEYARLQPKPISPLRAISQFKNPQANKDDIALVFISENNTLLAFAGMLSHELKDNHKHIYSNSGWWVHPQLGQQFAIPVLLKAFQLCNKRMILTECSSHTWNIIEKTRLFSFYPPVKGTRYFLRFYSGDIVSKRSSNQLIALPFLFADKIINTLCSIRYTRLLKRKSTKKYSINLHQSLPPDLGQFIEKHSGEHILKQDINLLNWIVKNPWITTSLEASKINYPFTNHTTSFKQEFLEIKKGEQTLVLLLLSIRDKHASIPYIYYETNSLTEIAPLIWDHLIRLKVNSLIIFKHEIRDAIERNGKIWLFKKNIIRFAGYSKHLNSIFTPVEFSFQDGEGDIAFT